MASFFAPQLGSLEQRSGICNEGHMVQQVDDAVNDLSEEFFGALDDQCQDSATEAGTHLQSALDATLSNDSIANPT